MSTTQTARIVPKSAAEQEMLDLLLRYPDGIREDDLNPKKRVRRGQALDEWKAAGWVIDDGTGRHRPRVKLAPAAIDPAQQVDAHARTLQADWRTVMEARARLDAQWRITTALIDAMPDLVRNAADIHALDEDFAALQASPDWPARSLLDEATSAVWGIRRVRAQAEASGVDWVAIVARAEQLNAAEDAVATAAARRARAADPEADPLGGDA